MSDRSRHVKAPSGNSLHEHRLDGGAVVRASDTARYRIEERTVGVTARVTVDQGLVWATVPDAVAAPTVEIRVGTAVVRARPAQLGVEVGANGDAVLEVVEGTVSVMPAGHERLELGANQAAQLSPLGAVMATATVSAEELAGDPWVADNLALDRRRSRDPRRTARRALLATAALVAAVVIAVVAVRAIDDDETVRSRSRPATSTSTEDTGGTSDRDRDRSTTEDRSDTTERERERSTTTERSSTTRRRPTTTERRDPATPDGSGASQTTTAADPGLGTVPLSTFGPEAASGGEPLQ